VNQNAPFRFIEVLLPDVVTTCRTPVPSMLQEYIPWTRPFESLTLKKMVVPSGDRKARFNPEAPAALPINKPAGRDILIRVF
jgi:hypothetical protein